MSAVRTYFRIRKNIIDRKLVEFGIQPILAYVLAPIFFFILSFFLFYKTQYAVYIYCLIALGYALQSIGRRKNDFLHLHFKDAEYRKLRIAESVIILFPFLLFLMYKLELEAIGVLIIVTILFSVLNLDTRNNFSLPTPFGKFPFEFATGFRKLFPFYLGICFLLMMAVSVSNFNLGLFSLALVPFLCMNFYSEVENPFYVWIYKKSAFEFLQHKCFVSFLYLTLLIFPIAMVMFYYFPSYAKISLVFVFLSYLYLFSYIIYKYVRFPGSLSVGQVILLTISYLFPPILLLTVSYYLPKANKNLENYLR